MSGGGGRRSNNIAERPNEECKRSKSRRHNTRRFAPRSICGGPYGVLENAVWLPLRVFEQLARFARSEYARSAYVQMKKPTPINSRLLVALGKARTSSLLTFGCVATVCVLSPAAFNFAVFFLCFSSRICRMKVKNQIIKQPENETLRTLFSMLHTASLSSVLVAKQNSPCEFDLAEISLAAFCSSIHSSLRALLTRFANALSHSLAKSLRRTTQAASVHFCSVPA